MPKRSGCPAVETESQGGSGGDFCCFLKELREHSGTTSVRRPDGSIGTEDAEGPDGGRSRFSSRAAGSTVHCVWYDSNVLGGRGPTGGSSSGRSCCCLAPPAQSERGQGGRPQGATGNDYRGRPGAG